MSIIKEELHELISQFNTVRDGSSKSYPDSLWKRAISSHKSFHFWMSVALLKFHLFT